MLLNILLLVLLALVVEGFARVIKYFLSWLSGGRRAKGAGEHFEESVRARQAWADGRLTLKETDELLDGMQLGWYQLVIVFLLGCMGGLLIEELWMWVTAGLTQSRVGLVWGPFSPLYGFGAVLLTLSSWQMRRSHASSLVIFLVSMAVGGGLEQLTGWAMETLFNATSWDYSQVPGHLTKWVSIPFLFIWGLLGLAWMKVIMPGLLVRIGEPTTRRQVVFVVLVAVYLAADIVLTLVCFDRQAARDAGVPAQNAFEEWVDENFSDEWISQRFQNLTIDRTTDASDLADGDERGSGSGADGASTSDATGTDAAAGGAALPSVTDGYVASGGTS